MELEFEIDEIQWTWLAPEREPLWPVTVPSIDPSSECSCVLRIEVGEAVLQVVLKILPLPRGVDHVIGFLNRQLTVVGLFDRTTEVFG